MSQNDTLLGALRRGETITSMAAIRRWGCTRLAARVRDLRDRGIAVKDAWLSRGDKRFKGYYL